MLAFIVGKSRGGVSIFAILSFLFLTESIFPTSNFTVLNFAKRILFLPDFNQQKSFPCAVITVRFYLCYFYPIKWWDQKFFRLKLPNMKLLLIFKSQLKCHLLKVIILHLHDEKDMCTQNIRNNRNKPGVLAGQKENQSGYSLVKKNKKNEYGWYSITYMPQP